MRPHLHAAVAARSVHRLEAARVHPRKRVLLLLHPCLLLLVVLPPPQPPLLHERAPC